MHTFPIPVVAYGPGSQPEDEDLHYLPMPSDMHTYRPPSVEAEDMQPGATAMLARIEAALADWQPGHNGSLDLAELSDEELTVLDQVLGEGEVSAQISTPRGQVRIQESVFAGVWRMRQVDEQDVLLCDRIEVGDIPSALRKASALGNAAPEQPEDIAGLASAPALLTELGEQLKTGNDHVINLTLLPYTPEDGRYLEQALGKGAAAILSRGYGNCRISATGVARLWWVQFFNSQDALILNTLEICDVPEVARAAREDLADSRERLAEVRAWLGE